MSFPKMQQALRGLNSQVQFAILTKSVDDFEVKETQLDVQRLAAVMVPMQTQKILIKPEGQRSWKWWEIYTTKQLNLDWLLQDTQGKKYRIMGVSDWKQAGFYVYELTEAPQ